MPEIHIRYSSADQPCFPQSKGEVFMIIGPIPEGFSGSPEFKAHIETFVKGYNKGLNVREVDQPRMRTQHVD